MTSEATWQDAAVKSSPEDRERIRRYYWTGKTGTHRASGLPAWELESSDNPGWRLWIREDGTVYED